MPVTGAAAHEVQAHFVGARGCTDLTPHPTAPLTLTPSSAHRHRALRVDPRDLTGSKTRRAVRLEERPRRGVDAGLLALPRPRDVERAPRVRARRGAVRAARRSWATRVDDGPGDAERRGAPLREARCPATARRTARAPGSRRRRQRCARFDPQDLPTSSSWNRRVRRRAAPGGRRGPPPTLRAAPSRRRARRGRSRRPSPPGRRRIDHRLPLARRHVGRPFGGIRTRAGIVRSVSPLRGPAPAARRPTSWRRAENVGESRIGVSGGGASPVS